MVQKMCVQKNRQKKKKNKQKKGAKKYKKRDEKRSEVLLSINFDRSGVSFVFDIDPIGTELRLSFVFLVWTGSWNSSNVIPIV